MAVVKVEPTKDHPVPYDVADEKTETFLDELAVIGNTADLQVELGASLELGADDVHRVKSMLKKALVDKDTQALSQRTTAVAAAQFLRDYGSQLAFDAAQARSAITYKLMELANCGEPRHELKALELLGKHSDIGLFTERSEITINYKNPEELENAIKGKIKRLLNADIIDVTPVGVDLDEELGVFEETEPTSSLTAELDEPREPTAEEDKLMSNEAEFEKLYSIGEED